MVASMIMLGVMAVPLNAKACADHAAEVLEALEAPHGVVLSGQLSRYDPAHRNVVDPPAHEAGPPAAGQPLSAGAGHGQSIDESAPDPFSKRFPTPRAAAPRDQILLDQANRSLSRSVFEMPGLMSDTQRADPRRTGVLEWSSPLPASADDFAKRLRERDGDPATR
jgi:hypothetical protein